jgi:tetratricopeptide (TPR) repeat protein
MSVVDRLSAALAGRYTINRQLGAGGMGTVYHATDVKHDRPVAIKVLRSEAAESVGAERFLREIRITAKLDHPQILMLIDSGDADGLLYYVMPFVDGESLRDRLRREAPLPVSEALRIAVQVADALAYAHKRGIVHRDVKPENILLADGHVKLADFGIARAAPSGQTTAALTQVGMALGTPAYMSPEQFFGDAHIDHRSDLYALACVVYEMLTGVPPFAGEAITKRLTADPPRLTATAKGIPPMVDLVVARALARDADDRHASVDEFAGALQAEISGPVAVRTGVATESPSPRAVFVGRERELADGRELLAGLAHGRGGLLLLGGEPGVGKTRLASALLDEARRLQALCLIGHCYEMEGMPPYTPFAEVLEYVSRLVPPATFRETLGDAAAEVARVQPLLRQQFPDIPEPLDLAPDKQRAHLHAQYRAFNERAAAVAPIVLLLDDLHWADEPSLALLANIATYLDRLPIVVIGTYRDTDLDTERPFAAVLETLTRQRVVRKVAVRRLPIDGTAALLAALGGGAPPDALVRALHAETDGNPFFVEEVFQHLREEGRLFDAQGQWLTQLDTDTLDVPEGVRLVVGRRLKRLSEACQGMLLAAAVVGPRFELATLTALAGQDEDTLLDALDEAVAAHLISEERGARIASYRFAHELIRQTLLAPLSLPRRQRWHLKVAQALEAHLGAKAAMRAADIAHHYFQAGAVADPIVTVSWLLQAADHAMAGGAHAEVLAHCERASATSDELPHLESAAILDRRAAALRALGRWPEALTAYLVSNREYGLARAHEPRSLVLYAIGDLMRWEGRRDEYLALLMAAMAELPDEPSVARARLRVIHLLAIVQIHDDYDEAQRLLRRAIETVSEVDDAVAREMLALARVALRQLYGEITDMVRESDVAEAELQSARARASLHEIWGMRLFGWRCSGQIAAGRAEAARIQPLMLESGHHGAMLYADMLLHGLGSLDGEVDDTLRWCQGTEQRWAAAGPWWRINQAVVIEIMAWRGRAAEAVALGRRMITSEVGFWRGVLEGATALAAALVDADHCSRFLEEHATLLQRDHRPRYAGAMLFTAYASEAFVHLGRYDEAFGCLPALQRMLGNGYRFIWGHALTARRAAVAAAAGGAWDEAEALFTDALVDADAWPASPLRADTDLWRAWMYARRNAEGDRTRVEQLLASAEPVLRRHGFVGQLAFAERIRGTV